MATDTLYRVPNSKDGSPKPTSELSTRANAIRDAVTEEYFSWSALDSDQALSSLAKPSRRPPPFPKLDETHNDAVTSPSGPYTQNFEVIDFDHHHDGRQTSKSTTLSVSSPAIKLEASFQPYPPYTYCAPASRNIFTGDDSHYMPFIPFADDKDYNYAADIDLYHYFAWQKSDSPRLNADEQVIALETLCRLASELKLLPKDLDEMQFFVVPCQEIISLPRKRDFPKWPPLVTNLKSILPEDVLSSDANNFVGFLNDFCANLNCLVPYCNPHEQEVVRGQVPGIVLPKISPDKILDMIASPCGSDCCLLPAPINVIASYWSDSDTQILSSVLRYAPDTSPCDLAIICRKPCRERTEVKESEFGLGLFLLENCEEGDLISEYVGEIIFEETIISRDLHAKHKGRSYVFDLNSTSSLDSAYYGNETRYINHRSPPNCSTKVRLVNGEHRIGVFANQPMIAGSELFIDYGPKFWMSSQQAQDSNAGGQEAEVEDLTTFLPLSKYVFDDPKDATYEP
ncbi:hypothetical protein CVT26_003033 [Gymnopilus dilepis]|uniref:SET domain-containing protein n=1 Tax=Gymnopilus dilepis TaxID=231916 RepID=A0A409W2N5_9AGAR|nr:hypothetical protein CVT26_003033 [Gymnopilus dilepis]